MKLFSSFRKLQVAILLGCLPLSFAACGGSPSESIGEHQSANTSDGGASQCTNLTAGPIQPQSVGQPFMGSEDFAFDGKGHIVGKKGNALVRANGEGASSTIASLPGQTYGLRYHPNGNLMAAVPGAGKLVTVSPTGEVATVASGLQSPNGIYVDFDGNTWLTEFGGAKVSRFAADGTKTVIVSGSAVAQAANGVVIDAEKKLLFYTEYSKGKIHRVALDTPNPSPVLVTTIAGAALDGLVLDACGNVYVVDQGNSKLYRVRINPNGSAAAPAELLASFPTNVANAQFGSGPGFEPTTLYVTGNPGTVYALPLGVKGAPVPTPPAE